MTNGTLQFFIEHVPAAIAMFDNKMRYLACSRRFLKDYDLGERNIVGRSHYEVFPEIPDRWKAIHRRCLEGAVERCDEDPFPRENGKLDWIKWEIHPWRDSSGNIGGIILFSEVITKRKEMEQALQEGKEHLTHLLTVSPAILYRLKAADFTPTWVTPNVAHFLGYSSEEALQPSWWSDHLHPQDRENALVKASSILDSGHVVHEYRFSKKDGEWIWVRDELRLLRDDQQEPIEIVGAWTDITRRKQAEREQEKLKTQFLQAQKMEAVGRLAGGIAHDYNNMLSVILGYTELALERIDPSDPLHADLKEVFKAATRSTDITRQLLAFARKQTIDPEVLDLNDTVEGMLKMLRRLIGEDIDLAWLPGQGLWPVYIDPSQVDQILANLCVNARDAIADVGMLTIETDNVSFDERYCAEHAGFHPGDFVLLAVRDNGCGMDQETVDMIFEPFFTTKEVGKGTGLGLSTVYGIIKQNNGFINVYSEPGKGTTFKIYLSRHAGEVATITTSSVSPVPLGQGETVLLVEDEAAILKLGAKFLNELGYTTLAAETPGKAIHLAQIHSGKIHLLITDVVMPDMNGRDLAEHLQTLHPSLKTLYMSGYTANIIAHHGVLKAGVHFIAKPFSKRSLAHKILEILAE